MEGSGRGSTGGSKVNPKCVAKGSLGGKAGSKGKVGQGEGKSKYANRSTGHPNISGTHSSNSECVSDLIGKGNSKGYVKGKTKGKVTGFGPVPSDTVKVKGKGAAHAVRLRSAAQDRYSEPKCVVILQRRYGCEVGHVLDIEGQSKDGRNWLEARGGGVALPKSHEGVGWKKLHGDVERPKLIRILFPFFYEDCEDVKLRVEGETEDHRSWLTECGKEIPKSFIHSYWEATDSSSGEDASCDDSSDGRSSSGEDAGCDDSSDGRVDGRQSLGSEDGPKHHVLSSDGWSDPCDHERFPEYLRDEHPDLDSDGLEDLYQGMIQDDADGFADYHSYNSD